MMTRMIQNDDTDRYTYTKTVGVNEVLSASDMAWLVENLPRELVESRACVSSFTVIVTVHP